MITHNHAHSAAQGEDQKKLDIIANEVFKNVLKRSGQCCVLVRARGRRQAPARRQRSVAPAACVRRALACARLGLGGAQVFNPPTPPTHLPTPPPLPPPSLPKKTK